jgi:hypothetical protein
MAKRRIIFGALICLLTAAFVSQTLSQTTRNDPQRDKAYYEHLRNMTPAQRQREFERRRRQRQMETQQWHEQRMKDREQNRVQRQRESKKRQDEAIRQALGSTPEQWKIIKPRLEKVKNLTDYSISIITFGGSSGSGEQRTSTQRGTGGYAGRGIGGTNTSRVPPGPNNKEEFSSNYGWKLLKPSDRKAASRLTKGERLTEEILKLIEDRNSSNEEIERKMETLLEIRQENDRLRSKARQELRKVLTQRQEATLIMMRELY